MKNKLVLSLSGGLDSSTLLGLAMKLKQGQGVLPVVFQYPSKHNSYETDAAISIAQFYGLTCTHINVESVFKNFKSDLLTSGGDIPEGHYESESMKKTVVPGRNLIFASILTGFAQSVGAKTIALGVHAGDHAIYPDCRPEFIIELNNVIELATENSVTLVAPFLRLSKKEIVQKGLDLGVPYELTRTCYKQQKIACGKCGSCVERLEAFADNNVQDPTPYENADTGPKN